MNDNEGELTLSELRDMHDRLMVLSSYLRRKITWLESEHPRRDPPPLPAESRPEKWYLRSDADGDAHRGYLNDDNTVTGACGVKFTPQPRMFGKGPTVLRPPLDPRQACPSCQRPALRQNSVDEERDGAAIRNLTERLSSPFGR